MNNILKVIKQYQDSFGTKAYAIENNDHDVMMDLFGITPELKRENRQYWGRELGMCWQRLVTELSKEKCADFKPAIRVEADEPVDLFIGNDAIDTKYRIGSGDSGTLKKFKTYGKWLTKQGYQPVLLIVREDNLASAIAACKVGGWKVLIGDETFAYLKDKTGVDLHAYLAALGPTYHVQRAKTETDLPDFDA